jgi:hypothetical protein
MFEMSLLTLLTRRCGVSANRCPTADRAEFRRRLLSRNVFRATSARIRSMMSGRVTSAMTRSRPPQSGQIDKSIANTLRNRSIQVIGAVGAAGSS